MVDSAAVSAPVVTPTAAPSPTVTPAPAAAPAPAADRRAATLAAMAAVKTGTAAAPAQPSATATATPPSDAAAATQDSPPPADAQAPQATQPGVEPEAAGIAAIRKAEQHMRKQLAAERAQQQAEIAAERATWKAKLDAADAREAKLAAARRDPISALQALGFTEADFEPLGRTLYGASPAGKADPKWKAAGEAQLREREQVTEVQRLAQVIEKMQQERADEREHAENLARVNAYADNVTKAVTEATPFARAALTKAPERARHQMLVIADRLYVESSQYAELREPPQPADVLAAYEAERRAELEMYGIDPRTIHKPAAAAPAPAAAPAQPPVAPSPTLAPSGLGARSPTPDSRPTREQLLEGMAKARAAAQG